MTLPDNPEPVGRLVEVEEQLGVSFAECHRRALFDSGDPIHAAAVLLLPDSPEGGLQLEKVNALLHDPRWRFPWLPFLVAFARSDALVPEDNGPGDYFAYDVRFRPPRVVHIAGWRTVGRNLHADDRQVFATFDDWYVSRLRLLHGE